MASSSARSSLSTSAGVEKFRRAFGDPKPPDITRKITACVSCRKQKIKCHMTDPSEPCIRCKKRGLPCTVNRSLQMLLEDDIKGKEHLEKKVQMIARSVNLMADKLALPEALIPLEDEDDSPVLTTPVTNKDTASDVTPPTDSIEEMQSAPAWSNSNEVDFTPASIPANCVPNVTNQIGTNGLRGTLRSEPDLITSRILSLEQAEELFNTYVGRLDHYLYRIISPNIDSLATARKYSPLLTAAICTVASLHHPSPDMPYDRCLQEFIRLSATRMFAGRNNIFDIQAFVIGAFWLAEMSWVLIAAAVRIATELQLHRAILRVSNDNEEAYLQARLYYLVYVCDHHFSIAYGRPPLTGEYEAIRTTDRYLHCAFAGEDDARLISQVNIWSITSQVFETFGTDSSVPTPVSMIGQLRRFNIALDTWRADWEKAFKKSRYVGNYPAKGVGLHYYFAKLYLCSHAFRGVPKSCTARYTMPEEMVEIAEAAVTSATYILRTINADGEIQGYLNGLPLYFDTMIAFAAVFLLKISTEYSGVIQVDTGETSGLVRQSMAILQEVAAKMKVKHLLIRIADGIQLLVQRYHIVNDRSSSDVKSVNNVTMGSLPHQTGDQHGNQYAVSMEEDLRWNQGSFPGIGLESYDLLEPSVQMYAFSEPWLVGSDFQQNTLDPWQGSIERT